jgi:hypothetical protein
MRLDLLESRKRFKFYGFRAPAKFLMRLSPNLCRMRLIAMDALFVSVAMLPCAMPAATTSNCYDMTSPGSGGATSTASPSSP